MEIHNRQSSNRQPEEIVDARCPICMAAEEAFRLEDNVQAVAAQGRAETTTLAAGDGQFGPLPGGNPPGITLPIGQLPPSGITPPIGQLPPNNQLPPGGIRPPIGEIPGTGIVLPVGSVPGGRYCLGPDSAEYGPQILDMIYTELALRQSLLALARRNNRWRSTLETIAEQNLQNARRLAAAYFMITGEYYWPTNIQVITSNGTVMVELRRLFNATQEAGLRYREYSGWVTDRCLGALYSILADDKVVQTGRLLRLMERL